MYRGTRKNIGFSESLEKKFLNDKRKQSGVAFPSAKSQDHILIIRLDLVSREKDIVRPGIRRLCGFFDDINSGKIKMDEVDENGDLLQFPLSKFNFSATIGFGIGFFEKLNISAKNTPRTLKKIPNNFELGDPIPYILSQTDIIIQLASTNDFLNLWVYENTTRSVTAKEDHTTMPSYPSKNVYPLSETKKETFTSDITDAISNWAMVIDMHSGFQRLDGRNLMGFHDGISNPDRILNDVIWTTNSEENPKFMDGTYMVFQKIEHDLEKWRKLSVEDQERIVGRSKGTGLLLGTLPIEKDRKLANNLHSNDTVTQRRARLLQRKLLNDQKNPEIKFFSDKDAVSREIQKQCPVWSHVRRANPRKFDGTSKHLIYRRGYLYTQLETGRDRSGLLFICFQKSLDVGFEYIKKNFLYSKDFQNLGKELDGISNSIQSKAINKGTRDLETVYGVRGINSKKDLVQPENFAPRTEKVGTMNGSYTTTFDKTSQKSIIFPLGGGYYFVPPIPNKLMAEIGELFF